MSLVLMAQSPFRLLTLASSSLKCVATISTGQCSFAGPVKAMGSSGNPLGRKRFRRQPKSDDAEYLVSHVSGSNYFTEGEDVKIQDDSQYPDWIWNMNLSRPKKPDELEFGTKEYWEALKFNNWVKWMRLRGCVPKRKISVDRVQLEDLEWKKQIRFRALAADDVDAGLDPDDYKQKPDRKMFLRPNRILEEEDLYPDELLAKHPEKFIKKSRPTDYIEQLAPKSRYTSRGKSGYFPSPSVTSVHPDSFLAKLPNSQELASNSLKKQPIVPGLEKGRDDSS